MEYDKIQNCCEHLETNEHETFRTRIGFNTFMKEVTRRGSSTAGGNMIASQLMGHVIIRHNWKEFVFHRDCSFNINSILESGLIAGGRESKEGRQTIFFTPLTLFEENPDEEAFGDDLSRKVHDHSIWEHGQDVVNWVKLSRAQDQGFGFWQTKSNAIIVHNLVQADCIHKLISQKGDRSLFERLPTPRPADHDASSM